MICKCRKGICYRIQLCDLSTDVFEGKLSLNEPAAVPEFQVRTLALQTLGSVTQEHCFSASHNARRQKPLNFGTVRNLSYRRTC